MKPVSHAYGHLVGTIVGVAIPNPNGAGNVIVAGTVMTPEVGQDHNNLLVQLENNEWMTVKYMETRRKDFINASISE